MEVRSRVSPFTVTGNLVDVVSGRIMPATVHVRDGRIARIAPEARKQFCYITPGLVDSHVHIESSMLPPAAKANALFWLLRAASRCTSRCSGASAARASAAAASERSMDSSRSRTATPSWSATAPDTAFPGPS